MKNFYKYPAFAALIAVAPLAFANQSPWSGSASLGLVSLSGGTESNTFNAAFKANYTHNRWVHSLGASGIFANSKVAGSTQTTATALSVEQNNRFNINENDYLKARIAFDRDLFSGVVNKLTESVSYGRRVINQERQHLDLEAGVGAQQYQNAGSNQWMDQVIGRLAADYEMKFHEANSYQQSFELDLGADTSTYTSKSAVKVALSTALYVKLGYEFKHNTTVPVGTEKTNTTTTVNIGWSF